MLSLGLMQKHRHIHYYFVLLTIYLQNRSLHITDPRQMALIVKEVISKYKSSSFIG